MNYKTLLLLLFIPFATLVSAQSNKAYVQFDSTISYLGDLKESDGPQRVSFEFINRGSASIEIAQVLKSCSCEEVVWTKGKIKSGEKGVIDVVYDNKENRKGPFEKMVTVYFTGDIKPVVLKLQGNIISEEKSLEKIFPIRIGALGLKTTMIEAGIINQGKKLEQEVAIRNFGAEPVMVDISKPSTGLSIVITPNPIPEYSEARMRYCLQAECDVWGEKFYSFNISANRSAKKVISIKAIVQSDFSDISKEEFLKSPDIEFNRRTLSFGTGKPSEYKKCSFRFKNTGKLLLKLHKVESDDGVEVTYPTQVPVGNQGEIEVTLDTKRLKSPKVLSTIVVYTNSPKRPIVKLFITGTIKQ